MMNKQTAGQDIIYHNYNNTAIVVVAICVVAAAAVAITAAMLAANDFTTTWIGASLTIPHFFSNFIRREGVKVFINISIHR